MNIPQAMRSKTYRLLAALSIALLTTACDQTQQASAPSPSFEQPEHLSRCLPALYAFDALAKQYSGDQIGQRIAGTPWLRLSRLDHYILQSPKLSETTLGAVLLPMQFNALKALKIEQQAISASALNTWQTSFNIKDSHHFISYCTGEAVFAQLRDAQATLNWLKTIKPAISRLGKTPQYTNTSPPPLNDYKPWRTYTLELMPAQSVSYAKSTIGLPLLGPTNEQELLRRYAPNYNISQQQKHIAPRAVDWQGESIITTEALKSYGYVDLGFWENEVLFRLHYLSWLNEANGSAAHSGFITRMNVKTNGKVLAVETIALNGANYQLYAPQALAPEQAVGKAHYYATPVTPKMSLFIGGMPLGILAAKPLSNAKDISNYSLARFDRLYQLPSLNGNKSIFNKHGGIAQTERGLARLNTLFGVKSRRGKHIEELQINADLDLYFDDPVLLEKLGLGGAKLP